MAGAGSRFAEKGYTLPKPLIDVEGVPMFVKATNNIMNEIMLGINIKTLVFVIDANMDRKFDLRGEILHYYPQAKIVALHERTEGAACTVLSAAAYLPPEDPVAVANCDQYIEVDPDDYAFLSLTEQFDSVITVFNCPDKDPKWSFAEVDENYEIRRVAEKDPISEWATAGLYYWSEAAMMINGINAMRRANDRVNNEFYVCPIYNYTIGVGRTCVAHVAKDMHGLGTPDDLEEFLCRHSR